MKMKTLSQVTEAIQAVLLAEVQQHLRSLRDTPVSSQPAPVTQHAICERKQISSKVGWTEEIELPYVGTSSPLKSKWAVYLSALSMSFPTTDNVLGNESLQHIVSSQVEPHIPYGI